MAGGPQVLFAEEGFFKPGQLATPFDQARIGKAVWRLDLSYGSATVFFVSPNGHFLANWHVLEPIIRYMSENGTVDLTQGYYATETRKPIEVRFNKPTTMVNDFLGQNVQIESISLVGIPKRVFTLSGKRKNDFVLAKVNYAPESWLTLSEAQSSKGQTIYVAGYPQQTQRNTEGKYQNADWTLRFGKGKVLKKASVGLSFKKDLIISDVDAYRGSSGSPVLNENGEVVGILLGGASSDSRHAIEYGTTDTRHLAISKVLHELGKYPVCKDCLSCARLLSD